MVPEIFFNMLPYICVIGCLILLILFDFNFLSGVAWLVDEVFLLFALMFIPMYLIVCSNKGLIKCQHQLSVEVSFVLSI